MYLIKKIILLIYFSFLLPSVLNSDLINFNNKSFLPNSYIPYSGRVVEYYQNSNIFVFEGNYKDGLENGEFVFYFENGIIKQKGNYKKGLKVGSWFEFNDLGILQNKKTYNENNISFISYFENMSPKEEGELIDDKKNGLWIDFDINGNKVRETIYKNGIVESVNEISLAVDSADTNEVENENINDSKMGIRSYFQNDNIVKEESMSDGQTSYFYDSGRLFKIRFFDNGNIDTTKQTFEYYESGSLKSQYYESQVKSNLLKNGDYIEFFENGIMKLKGYYRNGQKIDLWIEYYDNGGIYSKRYHTQNDSILYNSFIFFKDGSIKEKAQIDNLTEQYNGNFKTYYQSGTIKEEGVYIDNIKENLWFSYYENGNILSEINYISGTGIYYSYFETGELMELGYFVNDKKNGLWTKYHKNKNIKSNIEYIDGNIDINTPFMSFDENGVLSATQFVKFIDDSIINDGFYMEFFENGDVKEKGVYKFNIKHGKWIEYYDNGMIYSETFFQNGNGPYKSYYPSGEVMYSGNYFNNERDGKWFKYFKNGNKSLEYNYIEDKINSNLLCYNWYESGYKRTEGYIIEIDNQMKWDGPYIEYYENGVVFVKGEYKSGQKTGFWKEFYDNRIIKIEKQFLDGEPFGDWIYYNSNGDILKVENY